MSTVLIWFVVIVGIVGILLFWSLANTAGWADDRMEEIKNRETSCEAVITNQSSISGGMAMANKEKKIEGRLGYNSENGRYGLLVSDLWEHIGFHCGECLEVKVDDKWVKTRMEMDIDRNWYLVDTPSLYRRFRVC